MKPLQRICMCCRAVRFAKRGCVTCASTASGFVRAFVAWIGAVRYRI
jgi:hypothetical protein